MTDEKEIPENEPALPVVGTPQAMVSSNTVVSSNTEVVDGVDLLP